jgi:hypothetical protein
MGDSLLGFEELGSSDLLLASLLSDGVTVCLFKFSSRYAAITGISEGERSNCL